MADRLGDSTDQEQPHQCECRSRLRARTARVAMWPPSCATVTKDSVQDLAKAYATSTMAPTPNANGSPTHGAVVIRAILGPVVGGIAEVIRRVLVAGLREFS